MKKKLLSGAAFGLSFAGIASLIARYNGFNSTTLAVFLYLYVALGAFLSVKDIAIKKNILPDLLHRIVLVAEGEELEMKKLATGEKYKLKGEIEKI